MSQRKDLIKEILDQGKRSWNAQTDADGETDTFLTQIVMPLRKLERDGLFPQLNEHRGNDNGVPIIDKVFIVGDVDPDFEF